MNRSRKVANVSEESREKSRGQSEHKSAVPSMSLIFMDAATSIPTEDITEENMRRYTLDKYNMDITKHMNNLKTMTRSAVEKESKQIPPISTLRRKAANKTAKVQSGAGGSKDETEAFEHETSHTSEEVAESATPVLKKNSRKTKAAKSETAEADVELDVKNSRPVQTAKSDELLGKSVKKTDETKEILKIAAKKGPKTTKVKGKGTAKREISKLKETTKVAAKKEQSKLKRRAGSSKKETSKTKRTKAVAEGEKKK